MARRQTAEIDLTLDDSDGGNSGNSSDVQIVGEARHASATQTRKVAPVNRSKQARSGATKNAPNALKPRHLLNDAPIDFRSDTASSPGGRKSRPTEKAADAKRHLKEMPARKSALPGSQPRLPTSEPINIDDSSSSGQDLPENPLQSVPNRKGKSLLNGQGPGIPPGGIHNILKRPREIGSGSPTAGSSSKKARFEAHTNGRATSSESAGVAKKTPSQPDPRKPPVVSYPSSSRLDQQRESSAASVRNGTSPAIRRTNLSGDTTSLSGSQKTKDSAQSDQSENPFASLHSGQGNLSQKSKDGHRSDKSENLFEGLQSAQGKLGGRHRGGGDNGSQKDREPAKKSTPQLAMSSQTEEKSSPRRSPSSRGNAALSRPSQLTRPAKKVAEKAAQDSPFMTPQVDSGRQTSKQSDTGSSSMRSGAGKLLDEWSTSREEASPISKRVSSSEADQGYASMGSDQDGANRQRADPKQGPRSTPLRSNGDQRAKTLAGQYKEASSESARSQKVKRQAVGSTNGVQVLETSEQSVEGNFSGAKGAFANTTNTTATDSTLTEKMDSVLDSNSDRSQRDGSSHREGASTGTNKKSVRPVSHADRFEAAAEAAEANDQLQSEALRDLEQRQSRAQPDSEFAVPQSAASTLKHTAAYEKLTLAAKVEKALGQYLEELAEDNEYWTSNSLMRARISKELANESRRRHAEEEESELTDFGHMRPQVLRAAQKTDARAVTWGIERMHAGKPASSEKVIVPRQTFTTDAQDVPGYAHYVSIKHNILAANSRTLHAWPYFGDEFDTSQAANLKEQYHIDIEDRERKILRLRQAHKYEEYVESALVDLDCSWADVLRFLLDQRPDVGTSPDALRALNNRNHFCKEDFDRTNKRWVAVLSSLPPTTPEKLARAAVLCENFQKLARFPLWHVARRSDLCKLPGKSETPNNVTVASDELTCRICLRFNCPYHGEINEQPDDADEEDESETSSVSVVATDLVHPPKVNYRTRVAFPAPRPSFDDSEEPASRLDKKDLRYWQNFENKADARGPFYPCSHPGKACSDEDAECSCLANNLPCEKFCGCEHDCSRKFQGCSCSTLKARTGRKGFCFDDERCACWQLGRECDPDLCGGCGVCEVVDPVNKQDDDIARGRCQNASIQRAMPKCTILGDSGVHGLGLYACEDIHANEFVGEYKGEIITKEEAERRGAVYEHQKLSYLFSLNKDQEIDSTYFGNKIRFINHAYGHKSNLYPRIIMVNTVHRIALYAARSIRKGEELLFDYGPQFPNEQLGGPKTKKSAPHVRNANLLKDFYDVEENKDELGNVRAKGVSSGGSRQRAKPGKARGGARPGAGRKPRKKTDEQQSPTGANQQRDDSPFEDEFAGQDAGQRLAAYNVSDDRASDPTGPELEAEQGAEEDDDEYEESEDELEGSEAEESSDDEEAEAEGLIRRRRGRPSGSGRRSWRTG